MALIIFNQASSQSSHRGAAPALVYPSVPNEEVVSQTSEKIFTVDSTQDAAAALPSVPQEDPGEDSYATLKPQRSSKKKPVLESVD